MPLYRSPLGGVLSSPLGGLANECCCFCQACYCVDALPNTIYMTVTWCGVTSSIAMTKYFEDRTRVGNYLCENRYQGSGAFAGQNTAFFKVSVVASCDELGASTFTMKFCFDGCTTGTCAVGEDIALWTPMSGATCEPLYGQHVAGAPPGACGVCVEGYTLEVST